MFTLEESKLLSRCIRYAKWLVIVGVAAVVTYVLLRP